MPVEESGSTAFSYMDQPGGCVYVADAFYPVSGDNGEVQFQESHLAVTPAQLGRYCARGQRTALAQFYEVVQNGLILAKHVYRGLGRDCLSHDDMAAGDKKLVYVWKPAFDAFWERDGSHDGPRRRDPPEGLVFAVVVSPNNGIDRFPDVSGWIERWAWVDEDNSSPGHPVNHEERYETHLWSRE